MSVSESARALQKRHLHKEGKKKLGEGEVLPTDCNRHQGPLPKRQRRWLRRGTRK